MASGGIGLNIMRSDDNSSAVSPMVHPKDARLTLKIFTYVDENAVKFVDFRPISKEDKEMYKYICPICMRYFNSKNIILLLNNCKA